MLKQIAVCDVCGLTLSGENPEDAHYVTFPDGFEEGPTGMERRYERGHLCFHCLRVLVYKVLELKDEGAVDANLSSKFAKALRGMRVKHG
jgi:hypothetical protein